MEYLTSMSDKLAVLYGYNPHNKHISQSMKKKVLEEQLKYEEDEHNRLVKAKTIDKKFNGINVKFIDSKLRKIKRLKEQIQKISKDKSEEKN